MKRPQLCELCGRPWSSGADYVDRLRHFERCLPEKCAAEGMAGLLLAVSRLDDRLGYWRRIAHLLLAVPERHLNRARLVEIIRQLGGRASLDDVVLEACKPAMRRTLDRTVKDPESGLRSEKVNGRVVYVVDCVEVGAP